MTNEEITNPLFRQAVEAIDSGNITVLQKLLDQHPHLVRERLDIPEEGYFRHPYLIWFIADNPIRHDKLPVNIADITRLLIQRVKQESPGSFQQQIDYTFGLVITGRIPRECAVQIELMDVLIDAGVKPGEALSALANGNIAAAEYIVEKGGKLDLATAIGLDREKDIERLAQQATKKEKQEALIVAAFYGKAGILSFLVNLGVDVNEYLDNTSNFHSHATALHQAIYSASLDAVQVLVNAGARLDLKDKVYGGTPQGWAEYMQTEAEDIKVKEKYKEIEEHLRLH